MADLVKSSDGRDVTLDVSERADGSIKIRAECDGESHEHSWTIGPVDKPLPIEYDLAAAQADMEKMKAFAGEMAASKARAMGLKAGLGIQKRAG